MWQNNTKIYAVELEGTQILHQAHIIVSVQTETLIDSHVK